MNNKLLNDENITQSLTNSLLNNSFRPPEVPYPDRPDQDLDARHVFSQREGGEEARDHRAQRLRQDIPQWGDFVQHQVRLFAVSHCAYCYRDMQIMPMLIFFFSKTKFGQGETKLFTGRYSWKDFT